MGAGPVSRRRLILAFLATTWLVSSCSGPQPASTSGSVNPPSASDTASHGEASRSPGLPITSASVSEHKASCGLSQVDEGYRYLAYEKTRGSVLEVSYPIVSNDCSHDLVVKAAAVSNGDGSLVLVGYTMRLLPLNAMASDVPAFSTSTATVKRTTELTIPPGRHLLVRAVVRLGAASNPTPVPRGELMYDVDGETRGLTLTPITSLCTCSQPTGAAA